MQGTSLLTREEKGHDHGHDHHHDHRGHDHGHEHTEIRLFQLLTGVVFIVNSFIVQWTFESGSIIADLSAMIGAIILGVPIVLTAWKDIRRGMVIASPGNRYAVVCAHERDAIGNVRTAGGDVVTLGLGAG